LCLDVQASRSAVEPDRAPDRQEADPGEHQRGSKGRALAISSRDRPLAHD
jgi:hypothetical protein